MSKDVYPLNNNAIANIEVANDACSLNNVDFLQMEVIGKKATKCYFYHNCINSVTYRVFFRINYHKTELT